MKREEHIEHHKTLHTALSELVADFINETNEDIDETTLSSFIEWSFMQTRKRRIPSWMTIIKK